MKNFYYIISMLLMVIATSCGSSKKEPSTNTTTTRFAGYYTITDIEETDISGEGLTFNIEGQKRRITGFSGCNSYNGRFTLKNDRLEITDPLSTKRKCSPDKLDLEKRIFKTFTKVTRYTLKRGELTLYDKDQILIKATTTSL